MAPLSITQVLFGIAMNYILILILLFSAAECKLPTGCIPLEDHPLDMADPASIFGSTDIVGQKAPPQRTGILRQQGALPTHHFAVNEIKAKNPSPMILIPYEAIMSRRGITYDAYTLDRWSDPGRTDFMLQQSAWEAGKTWNKLEQMGTNMRQIVSGPDGNPGAVFTGKSGVRIGMQNSAEPVLTDFGDLYANFEYHANGGSLEVPLVRGSALLTHIFRNANPVVKPYCLISFAGQSVNFDCPKENTMLDAGSGHISATCNNGQLTLALKSTKPIQSVTKMQYAVRPLHSWQTGDHAMYTCNTNTCQLKDGGKTLEVTIPNAHGVWAYAFNYIGHYLVPPDWINKPEQVTCHGKRRTNQRAALHFEEIAIRARCDVSRNMTILLDVGSNPVNGTAKIQYGIQPASVWGKGYIPPMYGCTPDKCSIDNHVVTINVKAPSSDVKFALNIIGLATLPYSYPFDHPFHIVCGGPNFTFSAKGHSPPSFTSTHQTPPKTTIPHHQHTQQQTQPHPHTQAPKTTSTHAQTNPPPVSSNPGSRFIMELRSRSTPLSDHRVEMTHYLKTFSSCCHGNQF